MAELISREGNKVEFRVSVPASEVNRAYDQVWSGLARDVRVPGFRPGKAPRKVIEGRVGKGYVEQEVRERLLQANYSKAAQELKLSLVDANIDPQEVVSGQAFEFTVKGETYPEVKLADWSNLSLSAESPEITDDVMERTLGDLQERNATFEEAERAIEASDQVTVEEQGEDGGTYPIYLDVAEAHVREALLGKSKGDTVEITVPAHQHGDHEHPEHAVTVVIKDVKVKKTQELDDEFAKSLNFDNLERLRTDLKAELERRAAQEGETARREEFVSHLTENMDAEIPAALLDRRRDAMLEEIKDDLGRQGVKWGEYESFMQEQGKLGEFMADLSRNAESRVKRDLALEKLAEDLKVQVSDAEFNQTMNALAQANGMNPQELSKNLGPDGINTYYASLMREKGLQQAMAQLSKPEQGEQEGQQEEAAQAEAAPEATQEAKTEEAQPEAEQPQTEQVEGEQTEGEGENKTE
ncbi:trigger factor [Deinococcus saxicola]|uniref:trigger factor n=1 Tax=Deinococcus saxicola TaxID=249406 RepID=UPI0039EF7E08